MTMTDAPRLDEAKLEQFVHQAVGDLAAAASGLMVHLGDRLGLYEAMAGAGPMTPAALAARTGTAERYVREWLSNQAAGGYVAYDAAAGTFELGAEQAFVLANENSPVFLAGAFETVASCYSDHDAFVDAFTTGEGVGWGDHDDRLYTGALRLFRPGYEANLVRRPGCRRSTASSRSCATAPAWSTSAAASAPRRSSWPAPSSTRRSSATTSTAPRSTRPARPPTRPGSSAAPGSRSRPRPGASRGPATTWPACSTACTTWATRSAPPAGSVSRWPTTAPCCSSSRRRGRRSRTT